MSFHYRTIFFPAVVGVFLALIACRRGSQNPMSRSWNHMTGSLTTSSAEPSDNSEENTTYARYGGATAVSKTVDQTWPLMTSDPALSPTFSAAGTSNGESVDQFKSCMDLQVSVMLDGPGELPGRSHTRNAPADGYECDDMPTTFARLRLSDEAFDHFTQHLRDVLKHNGLGSRDVDQVTKDLLSSPPTVETGD